MKPHHVLVVAAVLFMGAGVYAAFSTPGDAMWLSGVLSFVLPLIAAVIAALLATHLRREESGSNASGSQRPMTRAIVIVLGIATIFALVAVTPILVLESKEFPPRQLQGLPTYTGGPPSPEELREDARVKLDEFTNLVFAAAFSAGVAVLTALALAFLHTSDRDEADETSPAPAA